MTQNDAIQDGKRHIVAPMTASVMAFLFVVMVLLTVSDLHILLVLTIIPFAIIPIFLFRIYHITDWKIRVYSQLKGGEDFIEKAEHEWILIPWIDKYARTSEEQKKVLHELESILSVPEPMINMESLSELNFYFHSGITLIQSFFWAIGLGISIMLIIAGILDRIDGGSLKEFIYFMCLGGFLTLCALVNFFEKVKEYRQGKPAITLSDEGISLKKKFHEWSSIKNIEITKDRNGSYLEVTYKGSRFSETEMGLANVAVGNQALQNILDQYKQFITH